MRTSDATPASDADLRCPTCSARRTREATWCTQCYARFTEPAAAATAAGTPPTGAAEPAMIAGVSRERIEAALAAEQSAWDKRHKQAAHSVDEADRAARMDELMAQLSVSDGRQVSPAVSTVLSVSSTPVGKLMLIVGGGVLLLSVALAAMTLIGGFL